MIHITGDTVYFDGHAVAFIMCKPGSIRDRFEDSITGDALAEAQQDAAEWEKHANELEDKIMSALDILE